MKILVVTLYEGITNADVEQWADRVFENTVASGTFTAEQLAEMKADFLKGNEVYAQTKSPCGKQVAATKWRLDR